MALSRLTLSKFPPVTACRHWFRCLAAALIVMAVSAAGAQTEPASPDQGDDESDLARIEAYLNAIDTLRANFIQVAPDGSISDGVFYLARPGRVRFEYSPPSKILVVSKKNWITLVDYEIGQASRWRIADTPFRVLIERDIRFGKNIAVSSIERGAGNVSVSVFNKKDPKQGSIKLVFTDGPLELRQWEITDPRGQITRVGLVNIEMNIEIDASKFEFDDPRPRRRRRRR